MFVACKVGLRCLKIISFKEQYTQKWISTGLVWTKRLSRSTWVFWRHDELRGVICVAFLHFETSPHPLQLLRRMLKHCLVVRLRTFTWISLHRCEKTMNTFIFWMNCSFKASWLTRDSPCPLKLNITSYLWLWTSPVHKDLDSELL